jgi:hypothetical protein
VSATDVSVSRIPFTFAFLSFQLNEEENLENVVVSPEGSTSGEDLSKSGEGGSGGSSSSSSSSSDAGSDDGQSSEHEDSSPKVDVMNYMLCPNFAHTQGCLYICVDLLSFSEQMFCIL